ncbi:MAG: outer membrane protein assembly factor BamA [Myxococcota bacterium]|nr:outer membrane protein assembly factor BamA [Myxococcota bacterium]
MGRVVAIGLWLGLGTVSWAQEQPVESPEVPPDLPSEEAENPTPEAPDASPVFTWQVPEGTVLSVEVEGNRRVESAAVLTSILTGPGDVLSGERIRRDIDAVYATGFFRDVQVDAKSADASDGLVVTFLVEENPAIRSVVIQGNKKLDETDIREVIDLDAFSVFNDSEVALNQQRIRDLYLEKGYFLAEVDPVVREVDEDFVELVFDITENRKVVIQSIDITGNEEVPDRKILRYMQTRAGGFAPWLTGSGTFRKEDLDNDLYVVRSVFLEEGFVDVRVDEPKVYLSPDKRYIFITIHVEEGNQYRLGNLAARGDWVEEEGLTQDSVMQIVAGASVDEVHAANNGESLSLLERWFHLEQTGVELEADEVFQLTKVQSVMQTITDLYGTEGYAFANVVPLTETHPEDGTVDLTFDISKGQKVRIGRIHISGNDPTWDQVVRREIPLFEGSIYDGSALKEARARLERLGFFEEVRITTPRSAQPEVLDVHVDVVEQPTGSFSVGAGLSSYENFMFTGNISKNNFMGLGYVMSAAVNWSSIRQQGNLSFADPHFLDSRWTLKLDAYSIEQEYLGAMSTEQYTRGGGLAVGRYIDEREDVRLTVNYTLEDVGLTSITPYQKHLLGGQLYRNGLTSSAGFNLYVDKRNNRIKPTRGLFASLSTTLSGGLPTGGGELAPFLGGEFNLWENKANLRLYRPVTEKERFILRLNSTLGQIQSTDGSVVPYVHRYRAGGINSIRGYNWYSLGPTVRSLGTEDPLRPDDRLIIGGTQTWVNNLEVEIPIVAAAGISGVVFFDAGNAFGDPWGDGGIQVDEIRMAYGAGVRWFSPIGPLRFELGFPVNPYPDEKPRVFDFSIGSFF